MDEGGTSAPSTQSKDPRKIARKYQIDLCNKALQENIIVYLGTGCGKTHIAVLLMHELRHLIRKPSRQVCVFLAPTVLLVRQQALVIENSTDFKVRCHYGNRKDLKDHRDWNLEIEQSEILVMTPEIFLHILRHCFLRMDLISLLIFDECHHAQAQKRHPYAQIMKEFYKSDAPKRPRIFGMTASPIIGKGGSNVLNYTKCINSLEQLLDAKVCSVDDNLELESIAASPDMEFYFYGPKCLSNSRLTVQYSEKLDQLKIECLVGLGGYLGDMNEYQKNMKSLSKLHENLVFCLEHIGLYGALQAARILLANDRYDHTENECDNFYGEFSFRSSYLNGAVSILSHSLVDDVQNVDFLTPETFEEPFFSQKLLCLIEILSKYRMQELSKCIIFVKRIMVARALAYILDNLSCLNFWKCEFLVGCNSGSKNMSRQKMNAVTERFCSGKVNLLVATSVAEEGLDIQTCCLVVRFDLPETVASFIQSRGRARMMKSKYIFLLEKGNQHDEKLVEDFMSGESMMNNEISLRSSEDRFDTLEETIYRVDSTGASISTGSSISLLHRYCGNLPRDIYFKPAPKYYYMDGKTGIICRVVLPPNAAFRQVDSIPCLSKDTAKRNACLKACQMLHMLGALTDHLLPDVVSKRRGSTVHSSESKSHKDDNLREELHEMRVPALLKNSWLSCFAEKVNMHSYYIRFLPMPDDRDYRMFGLFLISQLPEEAESLELDLHLAHGRIVKTSLNWLGLVSFDKEEMKIAQNFQEMFLKIILDRVEFSSAQVVLGKDASNVQHNSATFYLLLPLKQLNCGDNNSKLVIDWATMRHCLSSPIFGDTNSFFWRSNITNGNSLKMKDGEYRKHDVVGSLIYTPHNSKYFFVDDILHEFNGTSRLASSTYAEYFKQRFDLELSHPEQPLLKAKHLFNVHNLLRNRITEKIEHSEAQDLNEHFVELPPELCCVKILGFSKDIGSSLSLLPSFMHRLENLLVAIELKHLMLSSFAEASLVRAECILEALTTEKCMERFSLERFEVLGDAFLKYIVGRHSFISFEGLDEGKLTRRRSSIVNNLNLYELALKKDLQGFIREPFEPSQFFALGHPCTKICTKDNESILHTRKSEPYSDSSSDTRPLSENLELPSGVRCTQAHRWLHGKTIADMVEALVGVFLVESGFKAAFAFLRWIGIEIDFNISDYSKACNHSCNNLSLLESMNIKALERTIGHEFMFKGLLIEALIHPSYNKHSGGCYQRLEFLGDAVLEYLITSYLYSMYPALKPGEITDLRSIAVNNTSLAHVAIRRGLHKHLMKDSNALTTAVNKFEQYVGLPDPEKEPACPKVLGDVVESCVGAVLLDTGFDLKQVWRLMLDLLAPALSFSQMQINSLRELRELCQSSNFELRLPDPVKTTNIYEVKVEVGIPGNNLIFTATNRNSKAARKMAAQEALIKLKNLGYKHKNKSLEETLRATAKKEGKLIGFDEEPFVTKIDSSSIPDEFSKLSIKDTESNVKLSLEKNSKLKNGSRGERVAIVERGQLNVASDTGNQEETGLTSKKTARSHLYEICAAYYWSKPIFECCKREGPDHLPMFTFKVNVIAQGARFNCIECFGYPKAQKKEAQESAAVAAVWCLKHLGYTLITQKI